MIWDRDLVAADVVGLTSLVFFRRLRAGDLSGIECLTALTFVNIRGSAIGHLRPLAALTRLTALILTDVKATDLSPLEHLPLTRVVLNNTGITDLSAFVANTSIGSGDQVSVTSPLDCAAQVDNISVLQARGVALTVVCSNP